MTLEELIENVELYVEAVEYQFRLLDERLAEMAAAYDMHQHAYYQEVALTGRPTPKMREDRS
jgi:hypothetical protein